MMLKTVRGAAVGAVMMIISACATAPAPVLEPAGARTISNGVRWSRVAAEHRAIFVQTFRLAGDALRELARGREPGTWAVILDADETVLDNSEFQLRLERSGQPYSEELWNDWVREEAALPLPGAKEFIETVRSLGGRVAIVTNREEVVCDATRRNLQAEKLAVDVVLCRGETGNKNPRFHAVANGDGTGLPPLEVLMWIGDNVGDFPGADQSLRGAPDTALAPLGRSWFVLPNPMYGSWEVVPVD